MNQHRREHDFETEDASTPLPARALSCVHLRDILQEYKALEAQPSSLYGIHQQSIWLENWQKHVNNDVYVLCIHDNNRLVFALPFEVARCRTAWVGRYPSGIHANANFPMMDRLVAPPTHAELHRLKIIARETAPKITALYFERQLQDHSGVKNPILSHFPKVKSPNVSLSASLEGGFEGILSRVNGKRRMKRHRQQQRGLESIGTVAFKILDDAKEIEETLDMYLDCKTKQLKAMGAPNTFAGPKHRAFMLANYLQSIDNLHKGQKQNFSLQRLDVGGVPRAILGTCLERDGIHIEIATHNNDETAQYSVGEYLICESIKEACNRGLAFYDLGLGDQRYKRSWCREETWHYDSMIPIAFYGHYLVAFHTCKSKVKAFIKDRPTLWRYASKCRSIIGPRIEKLFGGA